MTRRLAAGVAGVLAALAVVAPGAHGQTQEGSFDGEAGAFVLGLDPGTRLVRQTAAPLEITGEIVVDFRGRGETGTIVVRPPARGRLFAFETVDRRGRRGVGGFASLSAPFDVSPTVFARVRRTTPDGSRLCSDAGSAEATVQLSGSPGAVDVRLATRASGLLSTACAGPLGEDLAGALPVPRLSYAELRTGPRTLDMQATRDFSAGGYTGTLRSSLVVRVGRGRTTPARPDAARPVSGGGVALLSRWRVASVTGAVAVDVRSTMPPGQCESLDACGLAGTLTLEPQLVSGSGGLYGLRRRQPGLPPLLGSVSWRDAGRIVASLARPGAEPCSDTVPIEGGGAMIEARRGTARVMYTPDAVGTRCPGPGLPFTGRGIATGTLPTRAFRGRRVTLRLTGPVTFSGGGYDIRSRPDLTVVLERRR